MKFDAEFITELIWIYLDDDTKGKNPEIYNIVEYLWEQMREANLHYRHGEVERTLNSFQLCADSEDSRENQKAVKGVSAADVAFISSHYGYIFGLVWGENLRLKFWKG